MPQPKHSKRAGAREGFVLPPRHRLFVVFDQSDQARGALEALGAEGLAGDDVWVLHGEDGRRQLGLLRTPGLATMAVRLAQRALSNDLGYLELLDEALQTGAVVLVVRAPSEEAADRLGRLLRARSGRDLAYGAHWDFVPLAA